MNLSDLVKGRVGVERIEVMITMVGGIPVVHINNIVFNGGDSVLVEGEHDLPYICVANDIFDKEKLMKAAMEYDSENESGTKCCKAMENELEYQ